MALSPENFTKVNQNLQAGFVSIWTANGLATGDTLATMTSFNYFQGVQRGINVNDMIYAVGADDSALLRVTTISSGLRPNITTALFSGGGGGGGVIGPISSSVNGLVLFENTDGNVIKQAEGTGTVEVIDGVTFFYDTGSFGREFSGTDTQLDAQSLIGLTGASNSLPGYNDDGELADVIVGDGLSLIGNVLSAVGGGSGDMIGPDTSTQDAIILWDSLDGTLTQDSPLTVDVSNTVLRGTITFNQEVETVSPAQLIISYGTGDENVSIISTSADLNYFAADSAGYVQTPQFNIQSDVTDFLTGGVLTGMIHRALPIDESIFAAPGDSAVVYQVTAEAPITITLPDSAATGPSAINSGYYCFVEAYTDQEIDFAVQGDDTLINPNGSTSMTGIGSVARVDLGPDNGAGGKAWILTISTVIGSGEGDVEGPGSSTDNAVVIWDGVTGKVIKNSVIVINPATGSATFNIGGVTTTPILAVQDVGGNSRIGFLGDIAGMNGIIAAGIESPLIINQDIGGGRTIIQQHGTMYDYNKSEKALIDSYIVTQDDSASIFDWTSPDPGTITIPLWSATPSGFFFDVYQMSGNSVTLTPTSDDILQNVNGQTEISNIGAWARVSKTTVTDIWEVIIIDVIGEGTGDVTGPISSINEGLTVFSGTSGKIIGNPPFTPAEDSLLGYADTTGAVKNILIGNRLEIVEVEGSTTLNVTEPDVPSFFILVIVYPTTHTWHIPEYSVGKISIENNTSVLIGSSTTFLSGIDKGDSLVLWNGDIPYCVIVNSIINDTTINLSSPYIGPTLSNSNFGFACQGTVSINDGDILFYGTDTVFSEYLTWGCSIYLGSSGTSMTVEDIRSDISGSLHNVYSGTSYTDVPFYVLGDKISIVSDSRIRQNDQIFSSLTFIENDDANLSQSSSAYKNIIFKSVPIPVTGETNIEYMVIRPSNGYVLPRVNTIVPTKRSSWWPDGNRKLEGTVSWTQSGGAYITGYGTRFLRDFQSGDFIIMRRPGQNDFSLYIESISSDTLLYVNATNLFGDIVQQTYLKGTLGKKGYVIATNGNAVITGVGTSFLSDFSPGDRIGYLSAVASILSVNSNTSITLSAPSTTGVNKGAYYKLKKVNNISEPLVVTGDHLQFMEQQLGRDGNFQIKGIDLTTGKLTVFLEDFYDADDLYVGYWVIKDPPFGQGSNINSPEPPTNYSWPGPAPLSGVIDSFANGSKDLVGQGTNFTVDFSSGDNIIIYTGGLNGTYVTPWVAKIDSVDLDNHLHVTEDSKAPLGGVNATYAKGEQAGSLSFSANSLIVTGVGTSFISDFVVGEKFAYTYNQANNTTITNVVTITRIDTNTQLIVDIAPQYTKTNVPYCKVWTSYNLDTPTLSDSDVIFGSIQQQGNAFRIIRNIIPASNGKSSVILSAAHATSDIKLSLWGQRPPYLG